MGLLTRRDALSLLSVRVLATQQTSVCSTGYAQRTCAHAQRTHPNTHQQARHTHGRHTMHKTLTASTSQYARHTHYRHIMYSSLTCATSSKTRSRPPHADTHDTNTPTTPRAAHTHTHASPRISAAYPHKHTARPTHTHNTDKALHTLTRESKMIEKE